MGLFKRVKEKANETAKVVATETKKVTDNINKVLENSDNSIKVIAWTVLTVGAVSIMTNLISIGLNIKLVKTIKEPKIINNITINK